MKLFDDVAAISADGGKLRIEELTSKMDADSLLVSKWPLQGCAVEHRLKMTARIVRMLVCMNLFTEVAQGTFKSTPLARVYVTESPLAQAVIHVFVIPSLLLSLRY